MAIGGCQLPFADVPIRPSSVVVHGLLTTSGASQTILVERTLTGEVAVPRVFLSDANRPLYSTDVNEPIVSDGGIPVSEALVELFTPDGATLVAPEMTTKNPEGHGAGVYRFALPGPSLIPGGRYRLRVTTKLGEVLTAETVVPVPPVFITAPVVSLDRDNGTLELVWSRASGATHYQLDVENPFAGWGVLTNDTTASLAGTLRNVAASGVPRVFLPGFRQNIVISAIDQNVYDYYRSANNGFIGKGTISHVVGGLGLFGSAIPVARRIVAVTAPLRDPLEGSFQLVQIPNANKYGGVADAQSISVYVESPAARSDQVDVLTGGYVRTGGAFGATVGKRSNNLVTIAFLSQQRLTDTLDVFYASQRGDTLEGQFSRGAPARYVRFR
jgi:hypothetical protein